MRRWHVLCLCGVAAIVAAVGVSRYGRTQQRVPGAVEAFLRELGEGKPEGVDAETWAALTGAVAEVLAEQRVTEVTPPVAEAITNSLKTIVKAALQCPEWLAEKVEEIRWALPTFLQDPPTSEETALLRRQINELMDWAATRLGPVAQQKGVEQRLEEFRRARCAEVGTFLHGSAWHSLSEADLAAARGAFEAHLAPPPPGGEGPDAANRAFYEAVAPMYFAYGQAALRPAPRPNPRLAELERVARAARKRLREERRQQDLARHHGIVLAQELGNERNDLDGWALVMQTVALTDALAGGVPWSCRLDVGVAERGAVPVTVTRAQDGSLTLTAPQSAMPDPPQWRWLNSEVTLLSDKLVFERRGLNVFLQAPLGPPASPVMLSHFTDEDWTRALALEATAARSFCPALAGAVGLAPAAAGAGPAVRLATPLGLFPACSQPAIERLDGSGAEGPVRLLSAEGREVGSASLRSDRTLVVELGSRTIASTATFMTTDNTHPEPYESHWVAPVSGQVQKALFEVTSPAEGLTVVGQARTVDANGKDLCRVTLSDFATG